MVFMPRYNDYVFFGAARALFRCTNNPEVSTLITSDKNSLVTFNFNIAWANALNYYVNGQLDGFAIIHSDVAAQDFWLDVLIEEMKRTNADVVSAVIPIKDDRGLVSVAVETSDQWAPRVLSVSDVSFLPSTFDKFDGKPLLVNTGLCLYKFGEWSKTAHFNIADNIRLENGKYCAKVFSEDWSFSKMCHKLNLKVVATKKVSLWHDEYEWKAQ